LPTRSGLALAEKGADCPDVALVSKPATRLVDVHPRQVVLRRLRGGALESGFVESVGRAKRAFLSVTVLDGAADRSDDFERSTASFQGLPEKGFGGRLIGFDGSAGEKEPVPPVDDGRSPIRVEDDGVRGLGLRITLTPIRNAEDRDASQCRGGTVHRANNARGNQRSAG